MEDFKEVFENPKDTFCSYFVCVHCKERVERGIANISHHWMNCLKRTDGLIVVKNDFGRQIMDIWSINVK